MSPAYRRLPRAVDAAYDHYYMMHGAKPVLVYADGKYTDVVTDLYVTREYVRVVNTFAEAFRLKAESFRRLCDTSTHIGLSKVLERTADRHEEVAQRLEIKRWH